jgi:hypothetical protein
MPSRHQRASRVITSCNTAEIYKTRRQCSSAINLPPRNPPTSDAFGPLFPVSCCCGRQPNIKRQEQRTNSTRHGTLRPENNSRGNATGLNCTEFGSKDTHCSPSITHSSPLFRSHSLLFFLVMFSVARMRSSLLAFTFLATAPLVAAREQVLCTYNNPVLLPDVMQLTRRRFQSPTPSHIANLLQPFSSTASISLISRAMPPSPSTSAPPPNRR